LGDINAVFSRQIEIKHNNVRRIIGQGHVQRSSITGSSNIMAEAGENRYQNGA
jgi:hypothetical protein